MRYVVGLDEVGAADAGEVGGKGAQLGALARVPGVHVPAGCCVTTSAYRAMVAATPGIGDLLAGLDRLDASDREGIERRSEQLRHALLTAPVPDDVVAAVTAAVEVLGPETPCAVRSSATAEDLPLSSFAGQHDSFLNVIGATAVVEHIRRCWASLFTERAVTYRKCNDIGERDVHMAVVVQALVVPDASGVLFTADPVTSNRRVASVEATFGLGEGLASGIVNPDVHTVRDGRIVTSRIARKDRAVVPVPGGGTRLVDVDAASRERPVLDEQQVLALVSLARRIEAHLGGPQDIEWCLTGDELVIVQSRPITTLFPVPEVADDALHVYVSVGHQQMMTDPMRPFGLSVWQLTAGRPMYVAGSRLFVDVAAQLASPAARPALLAMMRRSDPLIADALETIAERGDLPKPSDEDVPMPPAGASLPPLEADRAIVDELVRRSDASVAALRRALAAMSGPALFDAIRADLDQLRHELLDPHCRAAVMAGIEATWWLNDHLAEWLGVPNAADVLTQGVADNVTSEMGLDLLDVADAIRPHPGVVAHLEQLGDTDDLAGLDAVAGGPAARAAIEAWLVRYGMRGPGEIDITRPRWCEQPAALVPVLLGHVRNAASGERMRRVEQGRAAAARAAHDVLERVRALPDGARKAEETARMIERLRTFIGFREHPKFAMMSRYLAYKQALGREVDRLVAAGVLREPEDAWFLTFDELHDAARTHRADLALVDRRREEFRADHARRPPRVMTSDGEIVVGRYRRDDVPPGALVGTAVSTGTVEGRARVVRALTDADVAPGEILVTVQTDPSWTPAFVTAAALVTEVGGTMTHGAVIAREYGIPAVVGVEDATQVIADGRRIRVDGTAGYVELLAD